MIAKKQLIKKHLSHNILIYWLTEVIVISYWCYTDVILVSYWPYTDIILIYHWYDTDIILIYHWYDTDIILIYMPHFPVAGVIYNSQIFASSALLNYSASLGRLNHHSGWMTTIGNHTNKNEWIEVRYQMIHQIPLYKQTFNTSVSFLGDTPTAHWFHWWHLLRWMNLEFRLYISLHQGFYRF